MDVLVDCGVFGLRELCGRNIGSGFHFVLIPKSMTPPSEVMRPPSNAAVIFLRPMAGKESGSNVSSAMAREKRWQG
ncbi:hypothetical protein [Mesorhizobium delmotii]|uniref:hypothetical protein n=1 Tax=Mesorhizobium delmotii TaxID=1631247 RepID=UPI0014038A83|nr:hypothetical protein [Mesorhizobium delmotii]